MTLHDRQGQAELGGWITLKSNDETFVQKINEEVASDLESKPQLETTVESRPHVEPEPAPEPAPAPDVGLESVIQSDLQRQAETGTETLNDAAFLIIRNTGMNQICCIIICISVPVIEKETAICINAYFIQCFNLLKNIHTVRGFIYLS